MLNIKQRASSSIHPEDRAVDQLAHLCDGLWHVLLGQASLCGLIPSRAFIPLLGRAAEHATAVELEMARGPRPALKLIESWRLPWKCKRLSSTLGLETDFQQAGRVQLSLSRSTGQRWSKRRSPQGRGPHCAGRTQHMHASVFCNGNSGPVLESAPAHDEAQGDLAESAVQLTAVAGAKAGMENGNNVARVKKPTQQLKPQGSCLQLSSGLRGRLSECKAKLDLGQLRWHGLALNANLTFSGEISQPARSYPA